MDSSLFLKYSSLLNHNTTSKETVINHIKEHTGITLVQSQIEINKNDLILYVSSSLKVVLLTKGINTSLKTLGFIYKP